MHKIWEYISNLGVKRGSDKFSQRTIVLTNQLNFVMLVSMILLFVTTFITLFFIHDTMSYGTLRVVILLFVCLLNLIVSGFGYTQLSKLSLIFLPAAIFLLGPTITLGYVEEESYTYYPYIVLPLQ